MATKRSTLRFVVNKTCYIAAIAVLLFNAAFTPGFVAIRNIDSDGHLVDSIAALEKEIIRRGARNSNSTDSQCNWYTMMLSIPDEKGDGCDDVTINIGFYLYNGGINGDISASLFEKQSRRKQALDKAYELLDDIVREASVNSGIAMRVRD